MTPTPNQPLSTALSACLFGLTLLAACTSAQLPGTTSVTSVATPAWPAPASPLDSTPIGPVESVGAAANE